MDMRISSILNNDSSGTENMKEGHTGISLHHQELFGNDSSTDAITTLLDDSKFIHGRVDPGREENFHLVESMPVAEGGGSHTSFQFSDQEKAATLCQKSPSSTFASACIYTCCHIAYIEPSP